jgi:hydroxyacylglutathione hydrolase
MIEICPIKALQDNYIWGITDVGKKRCIIVDPGEATPVLDFLNMQQLTLSGILITHHHYDHTYGISGLTEKMQVPVFGPQNEAIPFKTHPVAEGHEIVIEDIPITIKVLDIPGHTLGHIAYVANNYLFCGDTLFTAGCGKVFEGTPSQMYNSLSKLSNLPDNTLVYCGHEYTLNNLLFAQKVEPNNPDIAARLRHTKQFRAENLPTVPSTIELEKKTNPFLRCSQTSVIQAANDYAGKALQDPVGVFSTLREWKNRGQA